MPLVCGPKLQTLPRVCLSPSYVVVDVLVRAQEYSSCGDAKEVARLLHDLAVPFFHHELVKQALLVGMEETGQERWCALLGALSDSAEVSTSQMTKVGAGLPAAGRRQPRASGRLWVVVEPPLPCCRLGQQTTLGSCCALYMSR
jgi:hypothetical protein